MNNSSKKSTENESLNEIALARRVASGDDNAAAKLLEIALPRVEKTALYLCSDHTEREDVIQNTSVELVKSAGSFRGDSSFLYWVDRVTLYMATRIIEKKVRRRRLFEHTFLPVSEPRTVDEEIDYRKMQRELSSLLNKIGLRERTALVLHYLHGYSVSEIARMTETGVFTIRGRLRNGKKKLRKLVLGNPTLADWIMGTR